VQRRAAPPRTRLAVALQLDRASVAHGLGRLLVLAAVGAVDDDELRPTAVDARHVGRLEWQHHQCCPVATAVATPRRSPEAANALREPNREARPSGFEPETLFRRRPLYQLAIPVLIGNHLHSGSFRGDTSGHEEPRGDTVCSHLVPTRVPTDARLGGARRGLPQPGPPGRSKCGPGLPASTLLSWHRRVAGSM
jgi:hypothetical protein